MLCLMTTVFSAHYRAGSTGHGSQRLRGIVLTTMAEPTAGTGSSLNPEIEVNAVSVGDHVDQGLEFGGWVGVRPGSPPSGEGDGEGEPGADGP